MQVLDTINHGSLTGTALDEIVGTRTTTNTHGHHHDTGSPDDDEENDIVYIGSTSDDEVTTVTTEPIYGRVLWFGFEALPQDANELKVSRAFGDASAALAARQKRFRY